MPWFCWLIVGLFVGATLGVILGAVLCAAGQDIAKYNDGAEFNP
jgi:hypothetical protein